MSTFKTFSWKKILTIGTLLVACKWCMVLFIYQDNSFLPSTDRVDLAIIALVLFGGVFDGLAIKLMPRRWLYRNWFWQYHNTPAPNFDVWPTTILWLISTGAPLSGYLLIHIPQRDWWSIPFCLELPLLITAFICIESRSNPRFTELTNEPPEHHGPGPRPIPHVPRLRQTLFLPRE